MYLLTIGCSFSARLDTKYLPPPPPNAVSAGGYGSPSDDQYTYSSSRTFGPAGQISAHSSLSSNGNSRPAPQAQPKQSYGPPPCGGQQCNPRPYSPQQQPQQNSGPPIPILKYVNENNGDGSYAFE